MQSHKPRLTIGLPVFNGEQFLADALTSLLSQTYTDFELIISDNASTDATDVICKAYAARDDRIRYYRNDRNHGAAWNLNRVVYLSKGEYFKWAAHDDICEPQFVEECIAALDKTTSVVLAYCETILIDEEGKKIKTYVDNSDVSSSAPHRRFRNLLEHVGLSNPMFGVIRADALRRTRLIGSFVASDIAMLGELALAGRFHRISRPLFLRRDHPTKSNRANATLTDLVSWYSGKVEKTVPLYKWRLFGAHLTSIWRVQVGPIEKLHCYAYMTRRFIWKWKEMKNELLVAQRHNKLTDVH